MILPNNTIWRGKVSEEQAPRNQDSLVSVSDDSLSILVWKVRVDSLGNESLERLHKSNHHHHHLIVQTAIIEIANTRELPRYEEAEAPKKTCRSGPGSNYQG